MAEKLPQLIVGLGNPGPQYHETRHNAGFMTIDRLADMAGPAHKQYSRYDCELTEVRVAGRVITLAKPQTFMNLSGRAVGRMQRVFELLPEEILVVYDCLDLPLGRIRLRQSGGSGGHKGMESVIQALGTGGIPRIRIGIDSKEPGSVVEHVLSEWTPEEAPLVREVVTTAAEAAITAVRRGLPTAMNTFNAWIPTSEINDEQEPKEED